MSAVVEHQGPSVIGSLAEHYGMDKAAFVATIKATIMKGANVSNEQLAAFCLVAKQYDLNPFTKQIFGFPADGGIVPVVSVDGWLKLINSHPDFDGMEFHDTREDGRLTSITCRIFRKDRSHAVEVTEYMSECLRTTPTWRQWPARMLRHKATIQAARYAFGFAGIMEPDEAERIIEGEARVVSPRRITAAPVIEDSEERDHAIVEAHDAANMGTETWEKWWKVQPPAKRALVSDRLAALKQRAAEVDAETDREAA